MARKRVRRRPTCSKHGRSTRVGKSAKARTAGARGLNACRHHPERYKVKANASVRVTGNRLTGRGTYAYRVLTVKVGDHTYTVTTDPYYNIGGGHYTDVWSLPESPTTQQAIYDAIRSKRGGRSTKRNAPRGSEQAYTLRVSGSSGEWRESTVRASSPKAAITKSRKTWGPAHFAYLYNANGELEEVHSSQGSWRLRGGGIVSAGGGGRRRRTAATRRRTTHRR